MSKEDIWISRIPVPIRRTIEGAVKDNFDDMESGGVVTNWNIYSPRWCPVKIIDGPDPAGKSLMLKDVDPNDYARATRVFGKAEKQSDGLPTAKRPMPSFPVKATHRTSVLYPFSCGLAYSTYWSQTVLA